MQITIFLTSRGAYVNCAIMAMLHVYTHSIGNQLENTMVVFKMRDSVPSVRYSSICNVLRLWKISLIPLMESTDSMIVSYFCCFQFVHRGHVIDKWENCGYLENPWDTCNLQQTVIATPD